MKHILIIMIGRIDEVVLKVFIDDKKKVFNSTQKKMREVKKKLCLTIAICHKFSTKRTTLSTLINNIHEKKVKNPKKKTLKKRFKEQ